MTILLLILGLLMFIGLVVIHELGHFYVARRGGVEVEEFGLGFPPNIFTFKAKTDKILPKGTPIAINWIPLGGYVRFSGDENAASVPDQNDLSAMKRAIIAREGEAAVKRYFHFKPVWQRALIAVAGPMANFILAILIMAAVAAR